MGNQPVFFLFFYFYSSNPTTRHNVTPLVFSCQNVGQLGTSRSLSFLLLLLLTLKARTYAWKSSSTRHCLKKEGKRCRIFNFFFFFFSSLHSFGGRERPKIKNEHKK